MRALLLFALLACTTEKAPPESPSDAPSEQPATEPVATEPGGEAPQAGGEPTGNAPKTPQELYAECKDRVEGPETAGECKTDADCARAGCGQEVCTTGKMAAEVMTTCEMRLCFDVLDTCGCHDGVCSWALKAEVPSPGRKLPAPGDMPQ
jgi:eight-cysteine-cluster-containing protein